MEEKDYLNEIIEELMADPDWEVPVPARGMLANGFEWALLAL